MGAAAALLLGSAPVCAAGAVPSQAFRLVAQHNATASFTVHRQVRVAVSLLRPSQRNGYTAFDITSPTRPKFVYYALVRGDGSDMTGQFNGNSGQASGGVTLSTGTLPRRIEVGDVTLAAGRYNVAVVTQRPTQIWLIPPGATHRSDRLLVRRPTDANAVAASYRNPSGTSYEDRELPLNIPAHAHAVLTLADERWRGTSTVSYVNACLGKPTDRAACGADPFALTESVQPSDDPGLHGADFEGSFTGPMSASNGVSFYSALSGTVTRQSFVAVALP